MAADLPHEPETRQRVLESAVATFAEKGFRDATIHEICERAHANIAAVNYYFDSKEKLYAEAWRAAFQQSLAEHPRDGGVPPEAPPQERLRGRIRSMIRSMMDPHDRSFLIVQKEMANPTDLLREVQRECIRPLRGETLSLMRELLGERASERQARFCEASIMSQCFFVARWMRAHRDGVAPPDGPFTPGDADAYAEHVVQFSLAGLRAVREQTAGEGDITGGSAAANEALPNPVSDARGDMP
jgi:TetR/AcrR family transcriptional regulator, regulator of cefoperazone and chloramphenicol sensitivity